MDPYQFEDLMPSQHSPDPNSDPETSSGQSGEQEGENEEDDGKVSDEPRPPRPPMTEEECIRQNQLDSELRKIPGTAQWKREDCQTSDSRRQRIPTTQLTEYPEADQC